VANDDNFDKEELLILYTAVNLLVQCDSPFITPRKQGDILHKINKQAITLKGIDSGL
jgi:hypothetical protein